MSAHALMVLIAGLTYLASAAVAGVIFRLLGPTFHTRIVAHWSWRLLAFLSMVVLLVRAVTILFPGELVRVQHMTVIGASEAVLSLAVSLAILDWVMRDRSPPPWTVSLTRLVAFLGWDAVRTIGMRMPVARIGDPPPVDRWPVDPPGRLWRASVLLSAFVVIAGVVTLIAVTRGG